VPDNTISGFGDVSLSALWDPFKEQDSLLKGLSFNTGIIFPTGDPADQPLTGQVSPEVFQLGTGAYQAKLGAKYIWKSDAWNYTIDLNTTLPLDESNLGFKPAASYFGSISAGRSLNDKLRYNFGLNLTYSEADQLNGTDLITAFTTLATKLELVWRPNNDYSISGSINVPLYRDVDQTQLAGGPELQLGVSRSF